MNITPESRNWRKFTAVLQDVDDVRCLTEANTTSDHEEAYEGETPMLLVAILAQPWTISGGGWSFIPSLLACRHGDWGLESEQVDRGKKVKATRAHKHLALLILLGFACPLAPTGHKIMEITDDSMFYGLMTSTTSTSSISL